ncbi:MAG: glycosyltransferase family 39 protein [Anaerolineales bacterium]|nr:glycosyltransferase family 39 protein [Anaerolineales bacterium]
MQGLPLVALRISIILSLALFSLTTFSLILFPYGADYGEAPLIDQAMHISTGEQIYKPDFHQPPFTISNYPPLYPLFIAGLRLITNLPWFQLGRIISTLAGLASAIFIGLLTIRATSSRQAGILAGAIFLGHPYVMIWSGLARIDLLALSLSLAGLWLLCRYGATSTLGWMLSVLCLTLSIFTRQTYLLAVPLAGFIGLWAHQRKQAVAFILSLGTLCFLLFGLLQLYTRGGFYQHTVIANVNRFDIHRALQMTNRFTLIWPVASVLSILATIFALKRWLGNPAQVTEGKLSSINLNITLSAYLTGSIITAATVGKVGSDINYFLELIAASAILSVITLFTLPRFKQLVALLLVAQIIWGLIAGFFLYKSSIAPRWQQISRYESLFDQVKSATSEGIVLSDDYLDMVVLSGQSIYYQPFEYGQLYHAGLWNPSSLADQITAQQFPLILIGGDTLSKDCCWPEPLVIAIENSYNILRTEQMIVCKPAGK